MKRMIAILLAGLAIVCGGPAAAAEWQSAIEAQSRYYGVGWQEDGNHWSIEILLQPGKGQIAYPSAECWGVWALEVAHDSELTYTEQILDGSKDCAELGTIRLEPLDGGRILYSWMEVAPRVAARAVLLPVTDRRKSYMELLRETLNTVDLGFVLPEFRK